MEKTRKELIDETIRSNNPEEMYRLAIFEDDIEEINRLADATIKSGVVEFIYCYARDVKNAPIEKLADAMIKTKNPEYIYAFARDVRNNAPIEKLADALLETKNREYIFEFAKDVKDAPIKKIIDSFDDINEKLAIFAYAFTDSRKINSTYVETLMNEIAETDPLLLIDFISKNRFEKYNSFLVEVLKYMTKNLEKYKDILNVYSDYIVTPEEFDEEKLGKLNTEYNQTIKINDETKDKSL